MKSVFVSMLVVLTVALFGCASTEAPGPQPAPAPVEAVEAEPAPAEEAPVVEESLEAKDVSEDAAADSSGSDE